MPIRPGQSESKEEFISRCISEEIKGGYEQSQAAAICYSKWDRKNLSKVGDPQKRVMSKLNFEKKYEGIDLTALAEDGLEGACWDGYIAIGTKEMDGRQVPNCVPIEAEIQKIEEMGVNLAEDYPWEQCIADQTARYGDEEIANKVCGMIRSKYGR